MNEPNSPVDLRGSERTQRQTYNIVTDTVTGVNIRRWDNLLQGVVTAICIAIGIAIACIIATLRGGDLMMAALAGTLAGLLIGFLGSGTFLMIFRAIQHARGKHD